MATISHLPHVVANVLVTQAATALSEESEHLPEVGPSFRDATRVAGANPAIWADIFAGNREAVAAEIDAAVARLSEAAELIRSGDRDAVTAWHEQAGSRRRELIETEIAGGPLHELRVRVPNRPGIVAETRPGARPGGRQHRGHGALPRGRHDLRRDLPLHRRRRRGGARREAGPGPRATTSREPNDAVRSGWAASRRAAAAARQVRDPSGGADRRDGRRPDEGHRATSTPRTRGRRCGRSRRSGPRSARASPTSTAASSSRSRGWASAARAPPRSTSATPGRCCGSCRGGWRDSPMASGPSTATTRSGAAPWTGSPSRCA